MMYYFKCTWMYLDLTSRQIAAPEFSLTSSLKKTSDPEFLKQYGSREKVYYKDNTRKSFSHLIYCSLLR